MKSWSCSDLHYSLYLAPDRVRTCCQRFFVDNKIQGDVELFTISSNMSSSKFIRKALVSKQKLYDDINSNKKTGCSGCPFLLYKNWPSIDSLEVRHLSLEYHSVCNLKCDYCSDTYYGGLKSNYNVINILSAMYNNNSLSKCKSVVWGGGEPVVDKKFEEIFKLLVKSTSANYKVFTNAVKYSKVLNDLISKDIVEITTSIDAGTSKVFELVRGNDKLDIVIRNLKRYSSKNPKNVTIKYVFTNMNSSLKEVNAFISMLQENNLIKCYFQISCDFYLEEITEEQLFSMIYMYGSIRNNLGSNVFFDDLLWYRMNKSFIDHKFDILKRVEMYEESAHCIASYDNIDSVVIWGAGKIALDMIKYSDFFKHVDVDYLVDSNRNNIFNSFNGKEVCSPRSLLNNNSMIVVASAQGYSSIISDMKTLGIDTSRLVQGLIV